MVSNNTNYRWFLYGTHLAIPDLFKPDHCYYGQAFGDF